MGAKTSLLVYADGDPAELLRGAPVADLAASRALVAATHPGWDGAGGTRTWALFEAAYPPEGVVCAGSFPGVDILCGQDVTGNDLLSRLPGRYLAPGAGRRVIAHYMFSVTDSFAYAIWEDGKLIRSLAVSPDGAEEDIGERQPFEEQYWNGGCYELELGETALLSLLGFRVEGSFRDNRVDAEAIRLFEFAVPPANPITQEMVDEFMRTHTRTTYRVGPDGKLTKSTG
jgi:hypothetical protein